MKLTNKKAGKLLSALENGLSAALAFVLLVHAISPLQVKGAEPEGTALTAVVEASQEPETLAVPEPAPEPTVQDVLLSVCEERGYDEACAKHLLGMLWKESNNIATAVGDRGNARGYFQIWTKLHKIPVSCAEDLACSADWTISYLERNHYPRYVSYAIQCHNGCNIPNGYAASAMRHGNRLWNQPLEVTTAEERRLIALSR